MSRDGEYVAAASSNKAEHSIHVWSRSSGTLEKILEGPSEGILDVRRLLPSPFSAPLRSAPHPSEWSNGTRRPHSQQQRSGQPHRHSSTHTTQQQQEQEHREPHHRLLARLGITICIITIFMWAVVPRGGCAEGLRGCGGSAWRSWSGIRAGR